MPGILWNVETLFLKHIFSFTIEFSQMIKIEGSNLLTKVFSMESLKLK